MKVNMNNRRTYYRNNVRNSRFPYVLILVIISLLYVMNNMNKDNNELITDNEILQYEILEKDSIINSLNEKNINVIKKTPKVNIIKKVYNRPSKITIDDKLIINENVDENPFTNENALDSDTNVIF